jgi:hypothetical protein
VLVLCAVAAVCFSPGAVRLRLDHEPAPELTPGRRGRRRADRLARLRLERRRHAAHADGAGPTPGLGGGRVGGVALSPFIRPGTVSQTPYNHFSTLRTLQSMWGLPLLGYAASPNPGMFGRDVFTAGS